VQKLAAKDIRLLSDWAAIEMQNVECDEGGRHPLDSTSNRHLPVSHESPSHSGEVGSTVGSYMDELSVDDHASMT